MNQGKYDGLSAKGKGCVDKFSGQWFGDWASGLIDSQNAKMRVEVENKPGHEIIVASDDVIAEYKKILAPIEANWLAEMKGKGVATYVGILFAINLYFGIIFSICWFVSFLFLNFHLYHL